MTVLQLTRDGEGLEPTPNPDQLRPQQMVRQGKNTFLAGSDDLIWLALHLSLFNFRVLEFSFVNRFFESLDKTESEWLSEELIRRIEAADRRAITVFISHDLRGRFVEHVRLHNGATRNDIDIVQDGIIYADEEDVVSLRDALKRVNTFT